MNSSQGFKPEIKTFLVVAFIAVVVSVAGILLLRGITPTPATFPFVDKYQSNKFDSGRIEKVVSFYDSNDIGKKIILYDTYDLDYERNFYLTDEDLTRSSAVKLLEAIGNDEGKSPFISPGSLKKKYIVVQLFAGDYMDLFIADEEGNIITKGVKLGDSELGAYLLEFMNWESATIFRAKATPYPDGLPSYFITVDAATGKGLEKTQVDTDVSTWQTYRNDEFGFEVKYPGNAKISEGKRVRVELPYDESTIINEKYLEISMASGPYETRCYNPPQDPLTSNVESVSLGGNRFTKRERGEGATGHFYETISYSTFHAGVCYSFAFTLNSTPAAYAPEGLQHFNRDTEISGFEEILATFRFVEQ